MRDLFSWAFPLGRVFGIVVRVNILFPLVAIGLIIRAVFFQEGAPATAIFVEVVIVIGLLFMSVLLHEFGHCFGARLVDGEAREIMLWPLGGLAHVDVPHTPRANGIATAAGPIVNLVIFLAAGIFLFAHSVRPPVNPFWIPIRYEKDGPVVSPELYSWDGTELGRDVSPWLVLGARLFWLNWCLFLVNLLPGFPLDGGRMFQCLLWPYYGFRQATMTAVYVGFVVVLIFGVLTIARNEFLLGFLALFVYLSCRNQALLLESGEDALLGYDFSQGYTSLESDAPARRRRPNFWQRWLQDRARRKRQREEEQREAEERRMDELLEKVQREGLQALTDEERRFLKRVSDKYRNRQ
jgi:Zn-dependent protease